jgi:hypothetical protein
MKISTSSANLTPLPHIINLSPSLVKTVLLAEIYLPEIKENYKKLKPIKTVIIIFLKITLFMSKLLIMVDKLFFHNFKNISTNKDKKDLFGIKILILI